MRRKCRIRKLLTDVQKNGEEKLFDLLEKKTILFEGMLQHLLTKLCIKYYKKR
jgi:hypothetical protein